MSTEPKTEEKDLVKFDNFLSNITSQNQTDMELPSFHNVLSSTVISQSSSTQIATTKPLDVSGAQNLNDDSIFKIPSLPLIRQRRKKSFIAEPIMESIAEESLTEVTWTEDESTVNHTNNTLSNTHTFTTTQIKDTTQPRNALDNITVTSLSKQNANSLQNIAPKASINKKRQASGIKKEQDSTNKTKQASVNKNKLSILQDENENQNTMQVTTINSTHNDTSFVRRSGRVRTKCLEFWNFEKAEVQKLENGNVNVTYHKLNVPNSSKKVNCSLPAYNNHPSQTEAKEKKSSKRALKASLFPSNNSRDLSSFSQLSWDGSPQKTPPSQSKRKLCPIGHSTLSKTHKGEQEVLQGEDYLEKEQEKKDKKLIEERGLVTPLNKIVRFSDLMFHPTATRDCKCYLSRVFINESADLYAGYLFLENGRMVWHTTKTTNLCVLEGMGNLQVTEKGVKSLSYSLKPCSCISVPCGKKLMLRKDGRSKMLKMFIALGQDIKVEDPNITTQDIQQDITQQQTLTH